MKKDILASASPSRLGNISAPRSSQLCRIWLSLRIGIDKKIDDEMELVLTSYRYRERELLEELRELGKFCRTNFKDVIRGEVEDLDVFLGELEKRNILSLSRVVPVVRSFQFSPEKAVEEFCEVVKPFIKRIKKMESFCVKVERRGLKGSFSSKQVAEEVGTFIFATLKERDGLEPRVSLKDPDKAVAFETLGRWCGIGIISKEMRRKYFYLKLP